MRDTARVVVIGGGVMGVSLLYHLAKKGWRDVMLVEKQELTAGSTWHAAGLCTHFAHDLTIQGLRAHSVRLYRDVLPAETGLAVDFHACGAMRVTRSRERMAEFRHVSGLAKFAGFDLPIIGPAEIAALHPLARTEGLIGGIHEPLDGHVDPSQATQAMAAGARALGARIVRHNTVEGIERTAGGEWRVRTLLGDIRAQMIVNAAGTWCREIGAMMGVDLPVVPMLHQYLVTDGLDAVRALGRELPIIRDPEESWYLRQERDGLIVGPYERDGQPWSVDGVPLDFGMELLPPDLDRVMPIVEQAMARVPALAEAGIKRVVNGPITFTPDANPLIGPAFGVRDAWLLCGSSMGVMEGGGAGRFLAEWMVEGEPPADALALDPRRFGDYADRDYRVAKAVECFGLQFGVHYPREERPAGRPRRTSTLYARQRDLGAVFGCVYGWERPNWFAPPASSPLTFGRPAWRDAVEREARALTQAAGVADLSAFTKHAVSGPGARDFMACLGANRAPREGRIGLVHALTPGAGVASEFSVSHFGGNRFYLVSAAAAGRHDEDLLRDRAPAGVSIDNVTMSSGALAIAGPRAAAMLAPLCEGDIDSTAFPWLAAREMRVAGVPARVLRVSYVGESGFEVHLPMTHLARLHDALLEAGATPFGAYAMDAMRIEKGYRAWGTELGTERTPLEAGLAALVKTQGRDFIGREALLARAASDSRWSMALYDLGAAGEDSAEPFHAHVVYAGGDVVGLVTSGNVGPRCGRVLALAWIRAPEAPERVDVDILGERWPARRLHAAPWDAGNQRPRR